MELHPFLEQDTVPNSGWWYVTTPTGECPSMRVGHTAVFVPGGSCTDSDSDTDSDMGRVFLIGGANPSGPFCETFVLDLRTRSWDTVDGPGLRARYEHAAFAPPGHPGKVFVFGGANQAGNLNDVQVLDTNTRTWSTRSPSGVAPAARTHHTSAAVGDRLFVYSGGQAGADPVGDRQVHCYDAGADAWSVLTTRGDSPKPRHGHAMAAVGGRVFVHGGMAGSTFYDDLHVLDVERGAWSCVKKKRGFPSARAAHGMVACSTDVFIFGGMNRDGALDDLHKLDTTTMTWSRVALQGPPPACRLDFAVCLVPLRVPLLPAADAQAPQRPDSGDQLCLSSGHARDVLERELKPGSASSRDSWTDVNASEAFFPIESTTTPEGAKDKKPDEVATSAEPKGEQPEDSSGSVEAGETKPAALVAGSGAMQRVMVLLVNGGMDTEGEIFDDTLIFSLQ